MLILGHRGAKTDAPENTIPSFECALQQGADGVELDVHLTADYQIVVCHHFDTGNVATQKRVIAHSTLQELRALDFGIRFSKRWRGTKIPTLAEALETVRPMKLINIVLRSSPGYNEGLAWEATKLVQKMHMTDQVLFSSFNHDMATAPRSFLPTVQTGLLYEEPIRNPAHYCLQLGAQVVQPYAPLLTKYQVESCRRNHLFVNAWTIDDPATAAKLERWGVDAIVTNIPGKLRRCLSEQSLCS